MLIWMEKCWMITPMQEFLRIPVEDMTVDDAGWTKFYEVRNAFFKEKGIDVDSEDFSFDKLAQALGMDEYSDEKLPQVGGPAISDYVKDIKVPDRFTMELDLKDIVGALRRIRIPPRISSGSAG